MSTKLIKIAEYRIVHEAEAAKMFLAEAGIPSFIEDAETVTMDWLLGNAIGYIKLTVPEDRVQEAVQVLQKKPATTSTSTSENACLACNAKIPEGQDRCPQCGWTWKSEDPSAPKKS